MVNKIFYLGVSQIRQGKFRVDKLKSPMHLVRGTWAVMCTKHNEEPARKMVGSLIRCSEKLGVRVEEPTYYIHGARNEEGWIDELRCIKWNGYKILMTVLDRPTKYIYKSIKAGVYQNIGVPTQNVLKEHSNDNLSYYTNVLCQMVVKMGGMLYSINLENNLTKTVMIIVLYLAYYDNRI